MSERSDQGFDEALPQPDSHDEAVRKEYGRQLAMESILQAAHAPAAPSSDTAKPKRMPLWLPLAAAAAIVLACIYGISGAITGWFDKPLDHGAAGLSGMNEPSADREGDGTGNTERVATRPDAEEFAVAADGGIVTKIRAHQSGGVGQIAEKYAPVSPSADSPRPVDGRAEVVVADPAAKTKAPADNSPRHVRDRRDVHSAGIPVKKRAPATTTGSDELYMGPNRRVAKSGAGGAYTGPGDKVPPPTTSLWSRTRGVGRGPTTPGPVSPTSPSGESAAAYFVQPTPAGKLPNSKGLNDIRPRTVNIPVAPNREGYDRLELNDFRKAVDNRLSTFSVDVDTGAYSNIRDLLKRGQRPPAGAVRLEELINYFDYEYPQPKGEHPIGVHVDVAAAPWQPRHRLVRVGLQARASHLDRPDANIVFLIDVSGSMSPQNKLPLLKRCMVDMVGSLRDEDRVAIAVYAGAAGCVLESTKVKSKDAILGALNKLGAGGSTNGGAGIELAYKIAKQHFVKDGINRVILASDGDFNVGVSNRAALIRMIEEKRKTGVFLSVLGFGRGNLQESQMEQIANKGNGTYSYIDSVREGRRVLVHKLGSTLMTVAKDVKIQVEFNPRKVQAYRLIGYENRMLAKQDFNDDQKDAGEIGSDHTVTALYEVVPVGVVYPTPKVDDLRYAAKPSTPEKPKGLPHTPGPAKDEMLFVKVRYKLPAAQQSTKLEVPVKDEGSSFDEATADFRFAASVAAFGMILRNAKQGVNLSYDAVLELAESSVGKKDADGYRSEFLGLVKAAKTLFPSAR